jgi:nucleobase:cation symporter-1, NCS1 family
MTLPVADAHLVGFVAMIPFFSTGLFSGWVANAAKGADFSLFAGLPVSGVLYWVLCRNIDVAAEAALAEEQADLLEHGAVEHTRPEVG